MDRRRSSAWWPTPWAWRSMPTPPEPQPRDPGRPGFPIANGGVRSGQCDDAIDAREPVDEAAGALMDSGVGEPFFEHQNGAIAARVALYADASDGSQPALFEPLDRCSLLAAQAADGQARPGEGMPSEQIGAQ